MQMAWTEKKSWGEGDPNRTRDDGEALGRKGEKGSVPESKTLGVGPAIHSLTAMILIRAPLENHCTS